MNWVAHAALIGWIPIVLAVFSWLPARRALLVCLIGGWLFLPVAGYGLVGYQSKHMVLSAGILVGTVFMASAGWRALEFSPRDIPMALWCLSPAATSLVNGLGPNEAAAVVVHNSLQWGVPYLVGRAFFGDAEGQRLLAVAIVVGGIVYVPLCLWEIRMSPQLHAQLYGFFPHEMFGQSRRDGSWRPNVFMHHGLMTALWVANAAVVSLWLWRRGAVKALSGVPMAWLSFVLVGTTVLTKSAGATLLLAVGAAVGLAGRAWRPALILALALTAPVYMVVRASGTWSSTAIESVAARVSTPERLGSLAYRLGNEEKLVAKSLEQPVLGWGRFGRWLVYDEEGRMATPDGFWVIALGQFGLLGLVSVTAAMILPVIRVSRALGSGAMAPGAPAAALAITVGLFMIDCLFNAMVNPIYIVAAGAIAALEARQPCAVRGGVSARTDRSKASGAASAGAQ